MANEVYTEEIQFKLHDKFEIFLQESDDIRSDISLLASASARGLLFAGNPNAPELKVFLTKQLVDVKTSGQPLLVRTVPLPGVPHSLACNADGSMLAINYNINENSFLNIYSVQSFLTAKVQTLYNMRLPHDTNATTARQLLWNPVITTSIAVIMSNGSVAMFTIMDQGKFEMHSLDKVQQVKCGCWSPKGKQIVFGFPNGKLQQFKPDLTPAKTIACPAGTIAGPFDVIALHWLSTFQFAAIFLQHGEDMLPNLYIINAPKGGTPTYLCYNDICYSSTGMRAQQFTFNHIPQWNLLLVSSANGIEVGILGTKDGGDTPTWFPYSLAGEARIEMPLVKNTTETYPIGFAIDTGSSHQLTVGEQRYPVMPMVFVLSTHGHLVAYDFLNLVAGAVDICSPPPPVQDASGEFKPLAALQPSSNQQAQQECATPAGADLSFGFGSANSAVTSTPAVQKDKAAPMFGGFGGAPAQQLNFAQPSSAGFGFGGGDKPASASPFALPSTGITPKTSLFGGSTTTAQPSSGFGGGFTGFGSTTGCGSTFSGFGGLGAAKPPEPAKPAAAAPTPAPPAQQPILAQKPQQQATPQPPPEVNKPLYTVGSKFNPPPATASTTNTGQQTSTGTPQQPAEMSSSKIDEIYREMIAVTINSFSAEIKQVAKKSNGLLDDLGDPSQLKACTKRLNLLQEINEQAKDSEFETDVQNLRHSLNEAYAMVAEVRSKLEIYKKPDTTRLAVITPHDPINQRQLAKLNSLVLTNQSQLQLLQQQIDGNWSDYQDTLRRRSKHHMHIPCLDGLYERMSNLKDMLAEQRQRLELIKKQLHDKGMHYKSQRDPTTPSIAKAKQEHSIDNLADSMLSLSVANSNVSFRPRLPFEKLEALRTLAKQQKDIKIIKPQRPNRVGLKSEVILETKLKCDKQAAALTQKHAKENQAQAAKQQQAAQKPATAQATQKPKAVVPSQPQQQQQQTTQSFNFAANNWQTPAAASENATTATKPASVVATAATPSPAPAPFSFAQPSTSSSFAAFSAQDKGGGFSFAQPKPTLDATKPPAVSQPQAPVSFSAKVITSEAADSSGFMVKPSVAKSTVATPDSTTSLSTTKASATKPTEDTPSNFNFGGFATATPTLPTFSGFGSIATSKSSANLFDGKSSAAATAATTMATTTTTTTTASVAAPTSTFSFGGLGSTFGTTSTASPFGIGSSAAPATFSFSQPTASSGGDKTQKPATTAFAGFGQKVDGGVTITGVTSLAAGKTDSAKPAASAATTVSSTTTTAPPVAATAAVSSTTTPTTAATDSLLGNLNICNPNTKDASDSSKPANIFSGFAAPLGGGSAPSLNFGLSTKATTTTTTTSQPAAPFSFAAASTATDTTTTDTKAQASTAAPTVTTTTTTTSSSTTSATATAPPTSTTTTTATTTAAAAATSSSTASTFSFASAFSSLSTASSTAAASTTTPTKPLFGGATSTPAFGTTTNMFGGAAATGAASTPPSGNIFGGAGAATGASLFGTAASATSPPAANIFGSVPKPAATSGANLFGGTATAAAPSPFGSTATSPAATPGSTSIFGGAAAAPAASGGSIFGGSGATSTTSAFGGFGTGATTTTASPFGGAASPFGGGASATSPPAGNFFGSPNAATTPAASGGSIFGQSAFGQSAAAPASGGSIFGGGATQQGASTASIFGGGATSGAASGGSIFGGAASGGGFGSPQTGTGFGGAFSQPSNAPAFGSPNTSGSFAQGGASVAQTGFGSPQQQQQQPGGAFSKPMFGGAPTFGSPTPAFGAAPSFGGAPTFGSPKPFGTFGSPTAATSPAAASAFGGAAGVQKNNLFETLGSTNDSGLSFGNLAQTGAAQQQPKPVFGGSKFMNYRA